MTAPKPLSLPEFRGILTATPSESAIVQLADDLSGFANQLDGHFKIVQTTATAAPYLGMMGLVLGIASGGLPGAIVLGVISFAGGLSGGFFGSSFQEKLDERARTVYSLSQLLKSSKPHRLRGLWQLSGSTEEFVRFLLAIAANWVEQELTAWGTNWWIRCPIDGVEEWLDPTIRFCYQFARSQGISPDELLSRLDALDAPSSPFPAFPQSDTPTTSPADTASTITIQNQPMPITIEPIPEAIDIVQAIIKNMFSFAVIGAPGSGKGFIGSHVWRAAQSQLGLQVFAIEPKNDPKERGYWETCEYVYRGTHTDPDATFGELPADTKTDWILDAIATYRQWVRSIERAPHILVFDEATVLLGHAQTDKKLFAEIRGLLSHLTSSGNSMGHYIFLLGHIPNLSVYGLSGGEMACLKNVYIYSKSQTDQKNLLAAGNTTYFGSKFGIEKLEEIKGIADRSKCGRAFYFGQTNRWYPMAKLPNLCGYDRDSKTFLDRPTQPSDATNWDSEIAILNQRTKTIAIEAPEVETNPITDWDNGYIVDDESLLEVLGFLKIKYGDTPISPSEAHRSQTSIRKLYNGKVDNLKALLFRAIQEELAVLDSDDKGNPVIRLL